MSPALAGGFSTTGPPEISWAPHRGGCSGRGAPALGRTATRQQLLCKGSVTGAPGLQSTGSVVVACGLSCSMACGIFPHQGLNPCLLYRQADSLSLSHQEAILQDFLKSSKISAHRPANRSVCVHSPSPYSVPVTCWAQYQMLGVRQ